MSVSDEMKEVSTGFLVFEVVFVESIEVIFYIFRFRDLLKIWVKHVFHDYSHFNLIRV